MREDKELLKDEIITEDTKYEEKSNKVFISEEDKEQIISDFIPEPINIPKYNIEKERQKHQRRGEREKKRSLKKSKKAYKIMIKTLCIIRNVLLFVLLTSVITAGLSSVVIRVNTSEYAGESAIRTGNPENIVVGKIKDTKKLNIKKSSSRATMADILRDNAITVTTYKDITTAIGKSAYPELIAKNAHGVISSLLYGTTYKGINKEEVSEAILKSASYIKLVTGNDVGKSASEEIGKYIEKSSAFKEIKPANLKSKYTSFTKKALSLPVLGMILVLIVVLIILTAIFCKGYAYLMIGFPIIISAIISAVAGVLYEPSFSSKNAFINCVRDAIMSSFHKNSVIFAVVAILIGAIVLLIGRALNVDDEYEEE